MMRDAWRSIVVRSLALVTCALLLGTGSQAAAPQPGAADRVNGRVARRVGAQ